jgi:hypothetical protein
VTDIPDRARLARLVGMLGSSAAGERENALAALDKELVSRGVSWGWLADLVAHGELPGGLRERVFKRLVVDRLKQGLVAAWAMAGGDAEFVRKVVAGCVSKSEIVEAGRIETALRIADDARKRAK